MKRLCDAYFAHNVVTNVRMELPKKFMQPDVTICVPYLLLVDWKQVFGRWPQLRNSLGFTNITADEIPSRVLRTDPFARHDWEVKLEAVFSVDDYFQYSITTHDIFLMCHIPNQGTFVDKPCSDLFDVEESIMSLNSLDKCFGFHSKNSSELDYLTLQRGAGEMSSFMFGIQLHNNITTRMNEYAVMYNSPGLVSRQGFIRKEQFDNISNHQIGAAFSYYSTTRLPPPYATKCHDYTLDGYQDRGHCFEACFIKKSLETFGKIFVGPRMTRTRDMYSQQFITVDSIINNHTISDRYYELEQACDQQCQRVDCREQMYFPAPIFKTHHSNTTFITTCEVLPRVDTLYEPKFDIVEFVTDMFSTFGFWLGLSVFSVFDLVTKSCGRRGDQQQYLAPSNDVLNLTLKVRKLQTELRDLDRWMALLVSCLIRPRRGNIYM